MSTIVNLRIETWGGKFVVVGEFQSHSVVARREFDTYGDALKELGKITQREALRYESFNDRGFNR